MEDQTRVLLHACDRLHARMLTWTVASERSLAEKPCAALPACLVACLASPTSLAKHGPHRAPHHL